jgi:putative ATPase
MRPQQLADYVGQQHLLAAGKPLHSMMQQGRLHSLLLWGPPGAGKTSLAFLLAQQIHAGWYPLSAVSSSVKDIRERLDQCAADRQAGRQAVIFIDEIHRFNKAQQDTLLPHVEQGNFVLMGATTENPSFSVNSALLSRLHVYSLQALQAEEIQQILQSAFNEPLIQARGIGADTELLNALARWSHGDARRALNILELAIDSLPSDQRQLTLALVEQALASAPLVAFDRQGDVFYEQISALHKAVRGSSPDAALYWLARMLKGGCDPLYIARRVLRMASEDIGNADPRALSIALDAWQTQERLGSPEGELTLAQAVVYLSVAPKSNSVYTAYKNALKLAEQTGHLPVPLHLRNAPSKLMKAEGYGRDYQYAHDFPLGYVPGESYWPEHLPATALYQPSERGFEKSIKTRLDELKILDQQSDWKRN